MQFLVAGLMVAASLSAGAMEIKKITHSTCELRVLGNVAENRELLEDKGYIVLKNMHELSSDSITLDLYKERPKQKLPEITINDPKAITKKDPLENHFLYTLELIDGKKMIGFQQLCEESEDKMNCFHVPRKLIAQLPTCVKK